MGVVIAIWTSSWLWSTGDRENNRHINKAIYPAFRSIENHCLTQTFPHETVRCQKALALMNRCTNIEYDNLCSANEYYDTLFDAGFDLPSFYESGYKPK